MVNSIGRSLGRAGLPPDFWTSIGFVFAIIAGVLYAIRPDEPYLAALAILVLGVFDVLDGAVARVMHKVSKAGSFNDSTLDRLAEIAIFAGIIYGKYTSPLLVLLALGFSLLVSYTRAKGDSLGVSLSGVGVGERAERLIVLIIASAIELVWVGVVIVALLAFVTFLQRYYSIIRKLTSVQ
jgi:archaetidylinositol phosphate synthase